MKFFVVIAIALALAMDAFAVSVGISLSLKRLTKRQTLRLAFFFGFFQSMMSLLGWFAARNVIMNMVDPIKGLFLVVLSIATSIDALAVGLSLAALQVAILSTAVVIGFVAFLMTIIGVKIGPLFGQMVGKRAELLGGLILILIGVKILLEHL